MTDRNMEFRGGDGGAVEQIDGVPVSRNPSDYTPGGHFRRRYDERDFPDAAIQRCIESGEATLQDNGRVRLNSEYLGYAFTLVVDPAEQDVVTCIVPDEWKWG